MKFIIRPTGYRTRHEVEDSTFFTPDCWANDGGIAEHAQSRAIKACESVGALLSVLYSRGVLTREECSAIAGRDDNEIEEENP